MLSMKYCRIVNVANRYSAKNSKILRPLLALDDNFCFSY